MRGDAWWFLVLVAGLLPGLSGLRLLLSAPPLFNCSQPVSRARAGAQRDARGKQGGEGRAVFSTQAKLAVFGKRRVVFKQPFSALGLPGAVNIWLTPEWGERWGCSGTRILP